LSGIVHPPLSVRSVPTTLAGKVATTQQKLLCQATNTTNMHLLFYNFKTIGTNRTDTLLLYWVGIIQKEGTTSQQDNQSKQGVFFFN
jgi:hypothetical protein